MGIFRLPPFMCFITSVPEPIPIVYPYEIWYKIEGRRKGYNEILFLPKLFD